MAHRGTSARHSGQGTVAEADLLPRLVHNSGPRSLKASNTSGLFVVATPLALPRVRKNRRSYQRLCALLYLVLPHMPVF